MRELIRNILSFQKNILLNILSLILMVKNSFEVYGIEKYRIVRGSYPSLRTSSQSSCVSKVARIGIHRKREMPVTSQNNLPIFIICVSPSDYILTKTPNKKKKKKMSKIETKYSCFSLFSS
jgi:hypothetical protein